jgi:hypothetical protein
MPGSTRRTRLLAGNERWLVYPGMSFAPDDHPCRNRGNPTALVLLALILERR